VIDMDPQANATGWLAPRQRDRTMNDVLYHSGVDGALDAAIVESAWPGVWIASAEEELASREADRVAGVDLRLKRVLRTSNLERFDTILIDSPPSLGPLMVNALCAAELAVIVTDSERGGLDGVARVLNAVAVVAEDSNPALRIGGIVMNMYDARVAEHDARWKELQELYGGQVLGKLPQRAAVATAYGASVPPRAVSGGSSFVLALATVVDRLLAPMELVG
ncbi:MAG: ParA family protein, partial [Longispora sp.]|nr:ParA family protein [Longispora sp. (in: high G+C Gram-positive bacteria)]